MPRAMTAERRGCRSQPRQDPPVVRASEANVGHAAEPLPRRALHLESEAYPP